MYHSLIYLKYAFYGLLVTYVNLAVDISQDGFFINVPSRNPVAKQSYLLTSNWPVTYNCFH